MRTRSRSPRGVSSDPRRLDGHALERRRRRTRHLACRLRRLRAPSQTHEGSGDARRARRRSHPPVREGGGRASMSVNTNVTVPDGRSDLTARMMREGRAARQSSRTVRVETSGLEPPTPACKAGALPAELRPHVDLHVVGRWTECREPGAGFLLALLGEGVVTPSTHPPRDNSGDGFVGHHVRMDSLPLALRPSTHQPR